MRETHRPHGIAVAAVALLAAACGGSVSDPTQPDHSQTGGSAAAVEVRLTCDSDDPDAPCVFVPDEVTVQAGGTVRWINDDGVFHTVTSSDRFDVRRPDGLFDEVVDDLGDTFERTFTEAGSYPYYCQPHAEFMAGMINVVE